jgi:tRNA (guanosine-2'-O-)-methyltransferase
VPARVRTGAGALVLSLLFAACGPAPAAKDPSAAGPGLAGVETPAGVALSQACVPTGPERCFDAIDDNCNGVVDEGCGLATGPLQFVVAWGDNPADVDLVVTDPMGGRVFEGNRQTSAGLRLDRDCPADACHGQNVENVVFEGAEPPRGKYRVEIVLSKLQTKEAGRQGEEAPTPVKVRFGARIGSRSYGADLELGRGDERKTFVFELCRDKDDAPQCKR